MGLVGSGRCKGSPFHGRLCVGQVLRVEGRRQGGQRLVQPIERDAQLLRLLFDPAGETANKDLAPISQLAGFQFCVVSGPKSGVKTMAELVGAGVIVIDHDLSRSPPTRDDRSTLDRTTDPRNGW